MLRGKRVLIGICGGIAAYKIPELVRLFVKNNAEVRCILTPSASSFVTPLTLATLSKNPVEAELFDPATGLWSNHVELGLWADLLVVAPLTASTLSKMAMGHSDNLLLTTFLSAKCPVLAAPAMDLDMYLHTSTQKNIEQLRSYGVTVMDARSGELASGLSGQGRMPEPEEIFRESLPLLLKKDARLKQKKVLITAGPTHEPLDPVRFIGNRSTGKMGIALAEKFALEGAAVSLILGPSTEKIAPYANLSVTHVSTAQEMLEAVQKLWPESAIGIFSAAVADYRPEHVANQKIKKDEDTLSISLTKNPDLLAWAGMNKTHQYLVGFALETNNEEENARKKLIKKNLDAIVLNSLNNKGTGFGYDTNQISIIDKENKITNFELLKKTEVALNIVNYVVQNIS
jgi:phosphopantothenoylcysteine decarboxylase / phosphopantothenate---cysteine ligase